MTVGLPQARRLDGVCSGAQLLSGRVCAFATFFNVVGVL